MCQTTANNSGKSLFDPYTQPDICSEKIVRESKEGREIESRCVLKMPGGGTRNLRAMRHVLLTGETRGMIDSVELESADPSGRYILKLGWLRARCDIP